jgi:hypothetical protein
MEVSCKYRSRSGARYPDATPRLHPTRRSEASNQRVGRTRAYSNFAELWERLEVLKLV